MFFSSKKYIFVKILVMNFYQEKISLLTEMIDFAVIDLELHDKEYDFLFLISKELNIEKEVFLKLFERKNKPLVIKNEFDRILHFYKLALLMHCDGVLHHNETISIHEIGIKMGLNPTGIKRILHLMENNTNKQITPEIVICAFQEQHN